MSDIALNGVPISQRSPEVRARLIQSTYSWLAVAVAGFAAASWLLSRAGFGVAAMNCVAAHKFAWLGVLLAYAALGAICSSMARAGSQGVAATGLGLAVILEALLFSPLIAFVLLKSGAGAVQSAALGTALLVAALTLVVKVTGHEFSWLRPFLFVASLLAFGLIVCSILFGFSLGMAFCYAMLALGSAFVLYDTSRVLNETTDDTPISAALELFGSIALVFWYMLRIFGDNGVCAGGDRKSTRLNSSHIPLSRMPSSA